VFGETAGARLDTARADTADPFGIDETAVLKYRQVLHDSGEGHYERASQFADRRWAAGQAIDKRPAGRIGERLKDQVQAA
jgi:hypothetical protein